MSIGEILCSIIYFLLFILGIFYIVCTIIEKIYKVRKKRKEEQERLIDERIKQYFENIRISQKDSEKIIKNVNKRIKKKGV